MTDPATSELIDALRAANPQAVLLAALVSTAMRVEPELLRRCRLLLPDADVTAESDLWNSALLSAASPEGLTLRPDVARALRADLAALPAALRDDACDLVDRQHRDEHWSVRLEERVNRLELSGGGGAAREQEDLLLAAVGELRDAAEDPSVDRQVSLDISRWLLRALARLPPRLEQTGAGFAAQAAGGLYLDRRTPAEGAGPRGEHEQWLSWLFSSTGAERPLELGVRFTPGMLELNAAPGRDVAPIQLPRTEPPVVDLEVPGRRGPLVTRVRLEGDDPLAIPVTTDEVVLAALDGRRWTVRRGGVPPPAGFDFAAQRDRLRPCLARDGVVADAITAVTGRAWTVLTGPPGIGTSTVLNAVLDELATSGRRVLVAWHFYGLEPDWDEPMAMVTSLEAQLRAAMLPYGELPSIEEADSAGRRMEEVLARAATLADARIVVAIDGLPGSNFQEVTQELLRLPFPSKPPPGVGFLVTTPFATAVRDWLEDADPWRPIDLGREPSEPVCHAMLEWADAELRVAFRTSRGAVPAQTLSEPLQWPELPAFFADELVELASAVPGRLARLIEWIAGQPPATVTLELLPAPLTGRDDEAWQRLEVTAADVPETSVQQFQADVGSMNPVELVRIWTAPAAVAGPGCTVGDLERAVQGSVSAEVLVHFFEQVPDLFRLGMAPVPADRTVQVVDESVRASHARRYGPEAVSAGHLAFARRWELGPLAPASRYELLQAAAHGGAALAPFTVASEVAFLARLLRAGGVPAARDAVDRAQLEDRDRAAVLERVLATVGPLVESEPDLAAGSLAAEWVRLGRDASKLGEPRWPLVLELERILDLDKVDPAWVHEAARPAVAATADRIFVAAAGLVRELDVRTGAVLSSTQTRLQAREVPGPEVPMMLAAGVAGTAVVEGEELSVLTVAGLTRLPARSPVTAVATLPDGAVVTGHVHGLVVIHQTSATVLAGHTGAVVAVAAVNDFIVTAGADGTLRVWERDGRPRLVYRRHRAPVRHVTGAAGCVVSGDDAGGVRAWDPRTGADRVLLEGHAGAVSGIVAVGGGAASAALDGSVRWWNLKGGGARTLRTAGPPIVSVTATEVAVITAEADGTLRWWDSQGGALRSARPAGVVGPVRQVLAAGDTAVLVHAGGVAVFPLPTAAGDDDAEATATVLLDPGGRRARTDIGGAIGDVDLQTGAVRPGAREAGGRVVALAAVDEREVARLDSHGTLSIGQRAEADVTGIVRLVGDTPRGRLLAALQDGSVVAIDNASFARREVLGPGAPVTALALASGAVLVGRADGTVQSDPPSAVATAMPVPVTGVAAWAPGPGRAGPGYLAVAGSDGSVWSFDTSGAARLMGREAGAVNGLVVLETQDEPSKTVPPARRPIAVSASADGALRAWDLASGRCVAALTAPDGFVALAQARGRVVARTAGGDLWVLRGTAPHWQEAPGSVVLGPVGSGLEVTEAPYGQYQLDAELSLSVGFDVDLLDVRVQLLPEDRHDVRDVRVLVARQDGGQPAAPLVPLHEPFALPGGGRIVLSARATGAPARPQGLLVTVSLAAPGLGGPVDVVALRMGEELSQYLRVETRGDDRESER